MSKMRELLRVTPAPRVEEKKLLGVPIILSVLLILSVIGSFQLMWVITRSYMLVMHLEPFWAYALFYGEIALTVLAVPALWRLRMPEILRIASIIMLLIMATLAAVSIPLQLTKEVKLSSLMINAISAALILVSLKIIRADISLRQLIPARPDR